MNRLRATMWLDVRLQWRNKLYHVTALVAILAVPIIRYFFDKTMIAGVLPVYFLGTQGLAYFYAASMVVFEKSERTLEGIIVSPLRTHEYLVSKIVTVGGLVALECLVVAIGAFGMAFQPVWFALGAMGMGAIFAVAGLAYVVRFQDLPSFLMPSVLIVGVLGLPFIHYFELWPNPIFYLLPTYPPFLLMAAAFTPQSSAIVGYGLVGTAVAIALGYRWSRRSFQRYIIEGQGGG